MTQVLEFCVADQLWYGNQIGGCRSMFDSFDARLRALLEDDGLDDAHGGGIAKHGDRFSYRLYDQPEPADGEAFFDLPRSSTPEVKWRAWMVTDEAREAYRAFVTNPDNGVLYRNVL